MSRDPGESARGGRAASTRPRPPPHQPADAVAAATSQHCGFPRARCAGQASRPSGAAVPRPRSGRQWPPSPWAARLHSNHPPKPRAALPPRPAFLTGNSRRRRLPGTAPAPPRGVGGRGSFSPLLTKQRSCRRHRARVSLVRAPSSAAPPPHASRAPAARALTSSLPPHGRPLPLPPPAQPRARARPPFRSQRACALDAGQGRWAGPERAYASDAPPTSV